MALGCLAFLLCCAGCAVGLMNAAPGGLILTAASLFPQVFGLRDILHQAHPPAWCHHCHRQLLHLPNQQEKGMCLPREANPWILAPHGLLSFLLWESGPEYVFISSSCR
jgi:hypothetical protein